MFKNLKIYSIICIYIFQFYYLDHIELLFILKNVNIVIVIFELQMTRLECF